MRRIFVPLAAAALLSSPLAAAEADAPVDLDFLAGDWTIYGPQNEEVGASAIEAQVPGAMLYEVRRVGDGTGQPLWFQNSESAGGWVQLFVGVNGRMREFSPQSAPGAWPLVLGADITLRDGAAAKFRMTLWKTSVDESRRLLERSSDGGATWTTMFDYIYRRRDDAPAETR